MASQGAISIENRLRGSDHTGVWLRENNSRTPKAVIIKWLATD